MAKLTDEQKKLFVEWIKEHLMSRKVVPNDEGNEDALIYNIVHNILDGPDFAPYNYESEQDKELASWNMR